MLVAIESGIVGYDVYPTCLGILSRCGFVKLASELGVYAVAIKSDDISGITGVEKSVKVYPTTPAHRELSHVPAFLFTSVGGVAVVHAIALVAVVGQFGNVTQHVEFRIVIYAVQAYFQVVGDCFRIVTMNQHQYAGDLSTIGFKILTVLEPAKVFKFFHG